MHLPTTVWSTLLKVRRDPARVKDLVVRRYRQPVYEFALLRGLEPEDADDVAQEVFLRVCREEFLEKADRTRGRFRTLLLAVTKHVISALRRRENAGKRDRRRRVSLEDFDVPEEPPGEDPEFDRLWARNLVEKALDRLKDDPTIPAYRLKIQGRSYREIAKELGRKETDVTNHIHRASERLRREIRKMVSEYSSDGDVPSEILALRKFL